MKKIIFIMMALLSFGVVSAEVNWNQIKMDSLFVMGVSWQKQDTTQYTALVTVDLNYGEYMNPLNKYAIVESYDFYNWWREDFDIHNVGETISYVDENGNVQERILLDFYTELLLDPNSESDRYKEVSRVGYYGLPFYIQNLKFECDIDDPAKGGIYISPDSSDSDAITLTRPHYEGIPDPAVVVETSAIPLGFGTHGGEVAHYNNIPVTCKQMDTTDNSRLSITLRPNPLYRHINPNTAGSETWDFSDIISSLPSISNKENLPFNLNIDFNYTGNYWNYSQSTEEYQDWIDNFFGDPKQNELYCTYNPAGLGGTVSGSISEIKNLLKKVAEDSILIRNDKYLDWFQDIVDNPAYYCEYPVSQPVAGINERLGNDIIEVISLQQQKENILLLDQLDKKLNNKRFFAREIVPIVGMFVIIMFYIVEILIIGVVILGIIPLMFINFIKGLKEVFLMDDIKRGDK